MDRSRTAVAQRLAEAHFRVEPEIERIFRLLAPDSVENAEAEPVKLLEVNPATPLAGIMPLYFGPHAASGAFYPSIIVEVHPDEFAAILSGALPLPHGWRVANEFERPAAAVSA